MARPNHPKGRALCQGGALPTSDQRHSPARLRRDGHSSGRRHREHHQSVGREGDVGKLSGSTNVTCAKGIKRNQKELNNIKVIQTAKHAKVNLNILAYISALILALQIGLRKPILLIEPILLIAIFT